MSKVVLLGLDGATFSLLDPLLRQHRLPQLARLASSGVRGLLRSTIHPLTPAAWTSAVTGLNPGKHGIYDFRRRRAGSYALELVNARQRDGKPLWTILSEQGKRVGVFNVPMTYPPDPVNGFMVSGMDAPGLGSAFTYPPSLRDTLLAAVPGYHIDLDEATDDEDTFLGRVQALADAEEHAIAWLLDRYPDLDFLMAVFVPTDRLYHTCWRYLDPGQPAYASALGARVRAVHEQLLAGIDAAIGRIATWAGESATFIVMSDHGFGPLEKDVYMNRFLLDAGYLKFQTQAPNTPFHEMVDWSTTRAYAFGFFGNINLNLRGREPQGCVEQGREAEQLRNEIIARLGALRDPESDETIVSAAYRREELYSGPRLADAPDILVIMRDYACMTRDGYEGAHGALVGPPMSLSTRRLAHTGNHRLDGILVVSGPGVKQGQEIAGANLTDIAPTALYALGVPVPGIMDGHVLRQAFANEFLTQHPPRRVLSPLPPVESAAQRQVNDLSAKVTTLEARLRDTEAARESGARYARQLQESIEQKNEHIARLESALRQRDEQMSRYQHSIVYRAYQRWQRLRHSGR